MAARKIVTRKVIVTHNGKLLGHANILRMRSPKDAQRHVIISRHNRSKTSRLAFQQLDRGCKPALCAQSPLMQGPGLMPTPLRAFSPTLSPFFTMPTKAVAQ